MASSSPTLPPIDITGNTPAPTGPFDGVELPAEQVAYLMDEYRRHLAAPLPERALRYFEQRFAELVDRAATSIAA